VSQLPLVVGAVIVDAYPSPTQVLAARRTRPPELAGQWEFPGGKVEEHESPEEALVREILEELALGIQIHVELLPTSGVTWPASNGYRMRLFYATVINGEPTPRDGHYAVRWLSRAELNDVDWLRSDQDALSLLRL